MTGSKLNLIEPNEEVNTTTPIELLEKEQRRRRQFVCCGKLETDEERCHRMVSGYQRKFKDIPALKCSDFLLLMKKKKAKDTSGSNNNNNNNNSNNVILVDCRFESERNVSMIAGALSIQDFENTLGSTLPPDMTTRTNTHVITYCTIGYRSGMEARRLKDTYGFEKVSNLEGIVAYSHALRKMEDCNDNGNAEQEETTNNSDHDSPKHATSITTDLPKIVNPSNGNETKHIHTFGQQWDCVDEHYDPKVFSFFELVWYITQVGGILCIRTCQRVSYKMQKLCCCFPSRRR